MFTITLGQMKIQIWKDICDILQICMIENILYIRMANCMATALENIQINKGLESKYITKTVKRAIYIVKVNT